MDPYLKPFKRLKYHSGGSLDELICIRLVRLYGPFSKFMFGYNLFLCKERVDALTKMLSVSQIVKMNVNLVGTNNK